MLLIMFSNMLTHPGGFLATSQIGNHCSASHLQCVGGLITCHTCTHSKIPNVQKNQSVNMHLLEKTFSYKTFQLLIFFLAYILSKFSSKPLSLVTSSFLISLCLQTLQPCNCFFFLCYRHEKNVFLFFKDDLNVPDSVGCCCLFFEIKAPS